MHIGGGVLSANLACSGARTSTNAGGSDFKPGIDFYSDASGRQGQALALQQYAATHNVRAVTLLIGANNYGFADIVQQCITDWLTSPSWWPDYCNDDSSIKSRFTPARVRAETANVKAAILNVRQAMLNAGYADSQYTILAQTYSSPIPRGSGFRYPQSGFTRQTIGGCGVWNRDADWANDTVVQTFNTTIRNATAQSRPEQREGGRHDERAGRAAAVREQRRPARGARRRQLADRGRRRQDRVGQPDPHGHGDLPAVPDPGGRPPELLGPARAAQLPAPGVQRRRCRAAARARSAGSG